jgi:hypothetical protein
VLDEEIAGRYKLNAEALGRVFPPPPARLATASTDMANVSLVMPAIHPTLGLDSLPAVNHQATFAAACATSIADKAALEGAIAMAWTAIDCATDDQLRERLTATAYRHG